MVGYFEVLFVDNEIKGLDGIDFLCQNKSLQYKYVGRDLIYSMLGVLDRNFRMGVYIEFNLFVFGSMILS